MSSFDNLIQNHKSGYFDLDDFNKESECRRYFGYVITYLLLLFYWIFKTFLFAIHYEICLKHKRILHKFAESQSQVSYFSEFCHQSRRKCALKSQGYLGHSLNPIEVDIWEALLEAREVGGEVRVQKLPYLSWLRSQC